MVGVSQRKAATRYLLEHYDISERRACGVVKVSRKTYRYVSQRTDQSVLRRRIVELARTRIRYGYKRIYVLLKREGIHVNKKRVHRLYCLEGLQIRAKRPRRHVSAARRMPPATQPAAPNTAWSMDFVSDQFINGRRFRALTIMDVFTRECLAVEPGQQLKSEDVVRVLRSIVANRGFPRRIYCDNGSEFSGKILDLWAYMNKVILEFSRPGKPTDNAFIESFNGSWVLPRFYGHFKEAL
jgi:putative transposase